MLVNAKHNASRRRWSVKHHIGICSTHCVQYWAKARGLWSIPVISSEIQRWQRLHHCCEDEPTCKGKTDEFLEKNWQRKWRWGATTGKLRNFRSCIGKYIPY